MSDALLEQQRKHVANHLRLDLAVFFPKMRARPVFVKAVNLTSKQVFVEVVIEKINGGWASASKGVRHHLMEWHIETKMILPVWLSSIDVRKDDLQALIICLVHFTKKVCLGHLLHARHKLSAGIGNDFDPLLHLIDPRNISVDEDEFESFSFLSRPHSVNKT
jgi:hypothetical protein